MIPVASSTSTLSCVLRYVLREPAHPRFTLPHTPVASQSAIEVTWNKWERVTSDEAWKAKTIWALLKLGAETLAPGHPIIPASREALEATERSTGVAGVAGPVEGVQGAGGVGGLGVGGVAGQGADPEEASKLRWREG